jgi:transcription elongation factor GreA
MRIPTRKSEQKAPKQEFDPFITQEKYNELSRSLNTLKQVRRPKESKEVQRLAAMGDFSENAGYQMAKARLRGINRRIDEIENLLKKAEIISGGDGNTIEIGNLVELETGGNKKQYRILGSNESDPDRNVISYRSPLGSSLLGKKIGDTLEIGTPKGKTIYKIIGISI